MRVLLAVALLSLLVPPAAAEFGPEENGYPVNVDGETVWPYVPRDLAERHADVLAAILAEPLNKVGGYTLMPYYPILTAEVQRLATEQPGLVRLSSAGQSRLGLDLWLLEIADFDNPDRLPLEEREVIYVDGGTHSNEYSGVYFTTEWAQFLLDEYATNETARWIVQNRHVFILPMVNPDGSNAMGRINALTVNVNRNFPATWGTVAADQPPLNWGGPWPASEPETQAVIGVMQKVRPDFVQSTHCCGNLWLHPYGAEQLGHAPDYDMFTNVCRNVFPDLTIGVERVRCGETWSTIYPASGTTLDEGYAQTGASSWSYEMSGRGALAGWGQPVVDTDVRVQEIESWRGVMHGMLHAEQYGALPRITAVSGDAKSVTVTVSNAGWGNVTEGYVRFGPATVALPPLLPGQAVDIEVAGPWAAGAVPFEMEWKKRVHPDSNWGPRPRRRRPGGAGVRARRRAAAGRAGAEHGRPAARAGRLLRRPAAPQPVRARNGGRGARGPGAAGPAGLGGPGAGGRRRASPLGAAPAARPSRRGRLRRRSRRPAPAAGPCRS